ncbi:MAG: DUF4340 domain-containing protein [Alphaproteobacteria bacterium]
MTVLAEQRKARLVGLALAAAALAGTAAVTVAIDIRSSSPDLASGPVLPHLADQIADARRIHVISTDANYRIERVQRGDQSVWVMRDHGDYPVEAGRLGQLTRGLEALQYVRRMTSDPGKQARLGVDDPRQGGHGVLVQIEDGRGALLVNLILGVETGGTYVRKLDQPQTVWAAQGDLPPLRDIASWLDLKPIDLDGQQIQRVDIAPPQGTAYSVARDTAQTPDFAIVAPARLAASSASAVTAAAERVTHLAPIDVQTAPAIQGAPKARLHITLFSGMTIDGDLIESDGKTWLKLVAHAQAPEQEPAALAINNRAAGWAYALSNEEADALTPALSTLLPARQTPHVSPTTGAPPAVHHAASPSATPPAAAPPAH